MVALRFVILFLLVVIWRPANATEPTADEAHLSVRVVSAGDPETTGALQQHILTTLAVRHVHLVWDRRETIRPQDVLSQAKGDEDFLANIWLDVTNEGSALLYIRNTRSDRFLLRTLPLDSGYDELARESLANIVESAIDVLLQGGEIGVTREEAEKQVEDQSPQKPKPPPAKKMPTREAPRAPPQHTSSRLAPSVFASAVGDGLANSVLRLGPQLGGTFSGRKGDRVTWFVWFQGGYLVSAPVQTDDVRLRFEGPNGRFFGGVRFGSGRFGWRFGAGGGVDAMKVGAESRDGSLRTVPEFWVVSPILSSITSAEISLSRRLYCFLSLAADVVLTAHDFDVARQEGSESLLSPWRVRPASQIGVGIFLGK